MEPSTRSTETTRPRLDDHEPHTDTSHWPFGMPLSSCVLRTTAVLAFSPHKLLCLSGGRNMIVCRVRTHTKRPRALEFESSPSSMGSTELEGQINWSASKLQTGVVNFTTIMSWYSDALPVYLAVCAYIHRVYIILLWTGTDSNHCRGIRHMFSCTTRRANPVLFGGFLVQDTR